MAEYHISGGKYSNEFVLGVVHCAGNESNLLQCYYNRYHSCEYYESIGVSCGKFQCSNKPLYYALHGHYIPKSPSIALVMHFSLLGILLVQFLYHEDGSHEDFETLVISLTCTQLW